MYESELVDILVGISEGNYIVEQRQVQKGSKQAEEAKQVMAVLAYRGMKEGSAIYRKVGENFMQLHPEVDYPMILELVKTFQAEERAQQKKELEALKKKIESKLAENSSLSQGKGR